MFRDNPVPMSSGVFASAMAFIAEQGCHRKPRLTRLERATGELLHAQGRMLCDWAETEPGSEDRKALWRNLHTKADELRDVIDGF